jgi:hypothetical protein
MPMLRYKTVVLVSLIIWLMVSWSGMHGYFCRDDRTPSLSLHNVSSISGDIHFNHGHHHYSTVEQAHIDVDIDLSQWLSAKLLKIDLAFLLPLACLILALLLLRHHCFAIDSFFVYNHGVRLQPPLRGPPVSHQHISVTHY